MKWVALFIIALLIIGACSGGGNGGGSVGLPGSGMIRRWIW